MGALDEYYGKGGGQSSGGGALGGSFGTVKIDSPSSRQTQPQKKKLNIMDLLKKGASVAGMVGKQIGDYVDRDKKGIGFDDIKSAPGRAAYDLLVKPTANLAADAVTDVVRDIPRYAYHSLVGDKARAKHVMEQDIIIGRATKPITDNPKDPLKAARQVAGNVGEILLDSQPLAGVKKLAVKGAKDTVGKTMLKTGAEGSLFGVARGAAESAQRDELTAEQFLADTATGGVAGGLVGGLIGGASRVANKFLADGINKFRGLRAAADVNNVQKTVGSEVLALPEGRTAGELPAQSVTRPVKTTGDGGAVFGNELYQPSPEVAQRTQKLTAILDYYENPRVDTGKSKNMVADNARLQAGLDESQGIVDELAKGRAETLKSTQGGVSLTKDSDGQVTGRVSGNSPFYSNYYKQNKKKPKQGEWLEEAHRQLSTGTDEEALLYQSTKQIHEGLRQDYQTHYSGTPVSDIGAPQPSKEVADRARDELMLTQEQIGAKRVAGELTASPKPAPAPKPAPVEVKVSPAQAKKDARVIEIDGLLKSFKEGGDSTLSAQQAAALQKERSKLVGGNLVKDKPKANKQTVQIKTKQASTKSAQTEQAKKGPEAASDAQLQTKRTKIDEALGKKMLSTEELTKGNRKAGPITQSMRAIENYANDLAGKGLESKHKAVRAVAKTLQAFAGELGKSGDQLARRRQYKGGLADATRMGQDVYDHVVGLVNKDADSLGRIHSVLDPDLATSKVDYDNLSSKEKEAVDFLRMVSDYMNDLNYKNEFVSPEAYEANKGGRYLARAYEEFEYPPEVADFLKQNKLKLDSNPYKTRGEVTDWKKENAIRDPGYLVGKRLQQTLFNNEVQKMGSWLAKSPLSSATEKAGYVKVADSKLYGDLAGKWIRKDAMEDIQGFFFTNSTVQKMYEVLNAYDRNPVRQARKGLMTVWNPSVRLGNRTSNYMFAFSNGINPVTFHNNMSWAKKGMKASDPLFLRMQKEGLVGNDVSKADLVKQLQDIQRTTTDKNLSKKAGQKLADINNKVSDSYGAKDDQAKLAAMKTWLDRGYGWDEAAKRVQRGFQDYNSVGLLYDLGAKSPVMGNAFIRFAADAARIAKNEVVDHPIRAASMVMGWKFFTDYMSALSNETAEDRKTRESRLGAPTIPLTGISLEVQTPWGAVNPSRLMGLATRNELGGGSGINQMGPLQKPSIKALGADPLIGGAISVLTDTDFRGKSIKDPSQNAGETSTLTKAEETSNRIGYLKRSYNLPVFNQISDIIAAANGEKNFYGKEKTVGQELLSSGGIKYEKYGNEEAQKQRDMVGYFNLKGLDKYDKTMEELKDQHYYKKISDEEYERRSLNIQNEKQKIIDKAKVGSELLSDKARSRLELAEQDNTGKSTNVFDAAESFKEAGGSKLLTYQLARMSGNKDVSGFFADKPELDPKSSQFQGFKLPENHEAIQKGAEIAKAQGKKLDYMQVLKLAGLNHYDKFFASNPHLDPTAEQFQGFKKGFGRRASMGGRKIGFRSTTKGAKRPRVKISMRKKTRSVKVGTVKLRLKA